MDYKSLYKKIEKLLANYVEDSNTIINLERVNKYAETLFYLKEIMEKENNENKS